MRRAVQVCWYLYPGECPKCRCFVLFGYWSLINHCTSEVFNRIVPERRPQLKHSCSLSSAYGKPLKYTGSGFFHLQINKLQLKVGITVADITEYVLLGANIIQKGSNGPADLLLSEKRMFLNGFSIPLELRGTPEKTHNVYAAEHYQEWLKWQIYM